MSADGRERFGGNRAIGWAGIVALSCMAACGPVIRAEAKGRREAKSRVEAVARAGPASRGERSERQRTAALVEEIRKADYEGDRARLKKLYDELAPVEGEPNLTSRVRYWRGFARWRRAINGFNEEVAPEEQQDDLRQAIQEFEAALAADPGFADAKIAEFSCEGLLIYSMYTQDPEKAKALYPEAIAKWKNAEAAAPDNPRFLWVAGPNYWRQGEQQKAMDAYERGLKSMRANKTITDSLEPSWGEPELLMSLAWSNLNAKTPDLNAAEKYAQEALELVPYWHYVRDILMPQIAQAKKNAKESRGRIEIFSILRES